MDARSLRIVGALAAIFSFAAQSASGQVGQRVFGSAARSVRTEHFIVSAPSAEFAAQVAEHAERYRRDLAMEWLGKPLGPWADPCPITVRLGGGAGGQTSFVFPAGGQGHPRQWQMAIQGPPDRVLDSVLPHEILHTVFATHFEQPLPRWADEGACTTVEHAAERRKHDQLLIEFLTTERGIPFNHMFQMRQYPKDILPLYSQGYSLANYLVAQGGRRTFVKFVSAGLASSDWAGEVERFYGFNGLSDLQLTWVAWVGKGSPALDRGSIQLVGAAQSAMAGRSAARIPDNLDRPAAAGAARSSDVGSAYPADTPSSDGWYARQAAMAEQSGTAQRPPPTTRGLRATGAVQRSVTRAPHFEPPGQIVLEWSKQNTTLR